jgi:D-alanyl-lipoteichoic acid acyltransferase DltB (MBOAT superfamily)
MLFPTTDFAIFFVIVFLGSWLLQPTPLRWKCFMILASYFFYGWWNWHFIFLLAGATAVSQFGARLTYRARTERSMRWAMGLTVAALLGLLVWFKYYVFLALNIDNVTHLFGGHDLLPLLEVTLPVGISFFTFMAISYVVDVYRGLVVPASWLDYSVYLSFFPHLVAGPIVREAELMPQIRTRRDPRKVDFGRAAWLILAGLFLKVVVSSYLATQIVDPVFANPGQHSALEALFAIYGYSVQIFADFAGYTNIAIGVALLLGFEFPQNFDSPYTSQSVQEFWRRWHMTLSRWLRDYVYIPLGGNRKGPRRTYINLMATMLLGGLWHGASWTFVVWGGLHGGALAWEHMRTERRKRLQLPDPPHDTWHVALRRLATFNFVCLGWVFFRAGSFATALSLLARLVVGWFQSSPLVTWGVLVAIAFGIGVQYLPDDVGFRVQSTFSRLPAWIQGVAIGAGLFVISTLGPQGVAPFIYFRF